MNSSQHPQPGDGAAVPTSLVYRFETVEWPQFCDSLWCYGECLSDEDFERFWLEFQSRRRSAL